MMLSNINRNSNDGKAKVVKYADRLDALRGAKYVINCIQVGGYSWTADYVTVTGDLCADLLSNIASEQRAKVVYEYLYRQIEDKKVRETIDFLLNREEAHNQMFRDAFNEVQDSGSNQDFGTTKAAKMYFSLSNPGPNAFAGNEVSGPKFAK